MAVEEGVRGQVHRVHPGILPNDTVARTAIGIGACSGAWLGLSACARAHAALNTASHVVSAASNDVTCAAPSTTAGAAAATAMARPALVLGVFGLLGPSSASRAAGSCRITGGRESTQTSYHVPKPCARRSRCRRCAVPGPAMAASWLCCLRIAECAASSRHLRNAASTTAGRRPQRADRLTFIN